MPKVRLRVLHASGCADVDAPNDIEIKDLIRELITELSLPIVAAHDGQPLEYRLDSTDLGRRLSENESIAGAGITVKDTLTLTVGVLAGSSLFTQKSRISISESSIGLRLDGLEGVDIRTLLSNEAALTMTLHSYRTTLVQLANASQELKITRKENEQLLERLREKNIATLLLVLGQIQTGFGVNLVTSNSTGGWLVFGAGLVWTAAALCFPFFAKRKETEPETNTGNQSAGDADLGVKSKGA